MRFFNTAGPIKPAKHYCIPPLERLDLGRCTRPHPRRKVLCPARASADGQDLCPADLARPAQRRGRIPLRVRQCRRRAGHARRCGTGHARRSGRVGTPGEFDAGRCVSGRDLARHLDQERAGCCVARGLDAMVQCGSENRWCCSSTEIDALIGDSLLSVLRQLRAGYDQRPEYFPQSVVLCGIRDVRDYRIHSGSANAVIAGGSAFNIKSRSLRLGDFSQDEVHALLAQHTEETGQAFTPDALETIWHQTQGQPWLVNALADQTCFRDGAREAKRSRHCCRCH